MLGPGKTLAASTIGLGFACGERGETLAVDTASASASASASSDGGPAGSISSGDGSSNASSSHPDSTSGSTTRSSTGSASSSGGTGSGTASPDDLEPLSDDFASGDLSAWGQFQPRAANLEIRDGQLRFEPRHETLWFTSRSGALLYKDVPGNFMVTAQVTARSLADPHAPPAPQFRLGGLMARDGDSTTGENYVFIAIGADGDNLSVETKSTRDSQSEYTGPAWPDASGELRICRVDAQFVLLIRQPGEAWHIQATFDRPDLPATLQVGPMAYAHNRLADLRVTYPAVDFASVHGVADCATDHE